MTPVYEAVFDAIGGGSGTRLFDAGCGSGLALQPDGGSRHDNAFRYVIATA